jgi:hypothetical protein
MTRTKRTLIHCAIALIGGLMLATCETNEITQEEAPVLLVANVTDVLSRIDITDPDCPTAVQFQIQNVIKNPNVITDTRFLDVILRSYRVRAIRTDGGTVVPRENVQAISLLVPAGQTTTQFPILRLFQVGAGSEAPFAALNPTAGTGGRDPETGRNLVQMDIIIEFFGETLAGTEVKSNPIRFPLTFCFDCGGCFPEG